MFGRCAGKVEATASHFGNGPAARRSSGARILAGMDIVPNDLGAAASSARDRLASFSLTAATAAAGGAGPQARAAMAGAAREAIFADAVFAAMHARFEELKSVAK
jgi:hypothetical protein